jgi:hypothetical protein
MKNPSKSISPLAALELEALEEGREYTRRLLAKKLQKFADQSGALSPPERSAAEEHPAPPDDD